MRNPWEELDLGVYEKHMSSENVYQLQMLNSITKEQFTEYNHSKIAILGIAGGNGLENIDLSSTEEVYGIDVNSSYLEFCRKRYTSLDGILKLIYSDLSSETAVLPYSDLLICNMVIEYLGTDRFAELIKRNRKNTNVISCVIQNSKNCSFVSSSEYKSEFDGIQSIHNDITSEELVNKITRMEFYAAKKKTYSLPNGKEFIRIDFLKK